MFYAKADNNSSGSSIAARARDASVAAAKAAAASTAAQAAAAAAQSAARTAAQTATTAAQAAAQGMNTAAQMAAANVSQGAKQGVHTARSWAAPAGKHRQLRHRDRGSEGFFGTTDHGPAGQAAGSAPKEHAVGTSLDASRRGHRRRARRRPAR